MKNPDTRFACEDFSSIDHVILRRIETVSASGEANLERHVFHGFGNSLARFGKDFHPRASLRAMFE